VSQQDQEKITSFAFSAIILLSVVGVVASFTGLGVVSLAVVGVVAYCVLAVAKALQE
jgi:hypothetical protein